MRERRTSYGLEPSIVAVSVLFVSGAFLRLWFLAGYQPAFMGHSDSRSYVAAALQDAFGTPNHPAGYPLFLRIPHLASTDLGVTIAFQHLLGLGSAALLYLAVRRLGGSRGAGLLPAGAVLFDGLALFFEHAVMAETVFTFLVAAALYAAIRALRERPFVWAAITGLCLGAATTVRAVGIALVPVVIVWLLARPGGWRAALGSAAALCAGATLVTAGYQAAQFSAEGQTGLTRAEGWLYYARAAPLADCARFRPPAGTRALCEASSPEDRGDGNHYLWDPDSPAKRAFGGLPNGNDRLRAFAWAVITHQPLDYLQVVGNDLRAYVGAGWGVPSQVAYLQDPANERRARATVRRYYEFSGYQRRGADQLSQYAQQVNIGGWPTAVGGALALLAPLLARGIARRGALMLTTAGLVLLVVPALTLFATLRFAVPAYGPLAAAAALGIDGLVARVRTRGSEFP